MYERNTVQTTEQAANENDLARTIFFPVYPVIAHQILERADIDDGICLDVGCGSGHLAVALATLSNLRVFALDSTEPVRSIADATIRKYHLEQRVRTMPGTVNVLPFGSASMNLVVSRGSFFFWESLSRGFSECLRVLKPGGMAYIGDGFGNARIGREIMERMRDREPGWQSEQRDRYMRCNPHIIRSALAAAGIFEYDLIDDESGFWIVFWKH